MKHSVDDFLPLPPAMLHILLALAGEDLHGYGIMQVVARESEGRYRLGPGTLYDNLQRLVKQGLVEEVVSHDPPVADCRRRYYRLISQGVDVLSAEIARLEEVVIRARLHLKALEPKSI